MLTHAFSRSSTLATDTTGFVAVDKTNRNIICTFRGSTSARNWLNNLHFFPRPTDICPGCALHEGFSRSAGEVRGRVVPGIRAALDANPGFNVVIAGHSLGGALATITAAEVRKAGIPAALVRCTFPLQVLVHGIFIPLPHTSPLPNSPRRKQDPSN